MQSPINNNDFLKDFVIIDYDSKDPNERIAKNNYIISKSLSKEKGNWSGEGLREKLETNKKILSILQNSFNELEDKTIKNTKKTLYKENEAIEEHLNFIEKELEKGVSKSGRGAKFGIKLDKKTYEQLEKARNTLESIKNIVNTSLSFAEANPNVLKSLINQKQKLQQELDALKNSGSVKEQVQKFDDKPVMGGLNIKAEENADVKEGSPRAGSSEEFIPPPIAMNAPPPPPPPGRGPPPKRIEKKFQNEPEPLDMKYSNPQKNNIDVNEAKKIIEKHIEELKSSLNPMNDLLKTYTEANTLYAAFNSENKKLLLKLKNNEEAAQKLAEDTPTTVLIYSGKKNETEKRTFFRDKEWLENNIQIRKYNALAKAKKLPEMGLIPEFRKKSVALAGIQASIKSTKEEIESFEDSIKTQKDIIQECENTNCGQLSLKNDLKEFTKLLEDKNRRLSKWEQDLRRLNASSAKEKVKIEEVIEEVIEDASEKEKIENELQQFIKSTEGMQEFINSSKTHPLEMGGIQFFGSLSAE